MAAPGMSGLRSGFKAAFASALIALGILAVPAANAAPPRDLDRYAQRVLETFETPGMAIAIVEPGRPGTVRAYGVRRMGEAARVDEHTLFPIGSTTKAFTSALLAMLVDEGKLTWDTKVQDVLPGFKMHDAYASSEMTVRDLLVHRSGLGPGAGDLLFYPTTTHSRADIVHRLRFIKPTSSFRSGFAYDNLLYIVAGEIIAAARGKSWEDVVRERLLVPLQMNDTSTSSQLPATANRAWPHARFSTEPRGAGPIAPLATVMNIDVAAPAGSLNASATDLIRWLELQLGRGLDPKTQARLYSEAQAREMWVPQTLMPIPPTPRPLELAKARSRAYALGWIVSDYRGQQIVSHGGGVPGSVTSIVILPERNVAFAIVTNSEEPGALSSIQYRLLDHYLGLSSPDWIKGVAQVHAERIAKGREVLAASRQQSQEGAPPSGPSLPLARYAARYRDAWYGSATLENAATGLTLRFDHTPSMSGKLEHVRYDTFRTRWADRLIEDAYVTFALNPDGSIERMTMRAVSPLADFSFDYHDLLFVPERAAER
jgi:CubicO group peptidase (beta-lactamase class C family)